MFSIINKIKNSKHVMMNGPFFGEKNKMIVHDLNKIKSECDASFVKKNDRKYFTPDTLAQAEKEGYSRCTSCLGNA